MHDYSYLTRQMISTDRWACLGEAASFVDPLYSLGGDFLAMSCVYASRCVADDLRGELDAEVVQELDAIYRLLVEDSTRTLSHNGAVFPHGQILGAKLWWDFFNYWSFMCAHFFQELWRQDAATLRRFRALGQRYYDLNTTAQRVLETWAEAKTAPHSDGQKRFIGLQVTRSILSDAHVALAERLDPAAAYAKMEADLAIGRELVGEVFAHALRDLGTEGAAQLGRALGAAVGGAEPGDRPIGTPLILGDRFYEVDGLPRRDRMKRYSKVARDLERAIGRAEGDAPLGELLERARAAAGVRDGRRTGSPLAPGQVAPTTG
jgi:hypothetical protein